MQEDFSLFTHHEVNDHMNLDVPSEIAAASDITPVRMIISRSENVVAGHVLRIGPDERRLMFRVHVLELLPTQGEARIQVQGPNGKTNPQLVQTGDNIPHTYKPGSRSQRPLLHIVEVSNGPRIRVTFHIFDSPYTSYWDVRRHRRRA